MANYGPYNDGFLTDYSGIAAAGSAFKGFAQGLEDADDRRMKKQEFDAKMKADQTRAEREALQQQLDMRKSGYMKSADGTLVEAPLSPGEREKHLLTAFGEGAKPTGTDDNGNFTGFTLEPNSPKAISARNSGMRFQATEGDKHNKEWEQFAEKITNPSARSAWGRYQNNIDKANTLNVLAQQIGMPSGQQAPANETREQRIARFNRADPRQLYEFAKGADQLTSNANSTVYGTDHLMPKDMEIGGAKMGEYVRGGPLPANAGEFIERFLDSANREGKYFKSVRDRALSKFTIGYEHLRKIDSDRWERLLREDPELAQLPPTVPDQAQGQGQGLVNRKGFLRRMLGGLIGDDAQADKTPQGPQDPDAVKLMQLHPELAKDYATAKKIMDDRKARMMGGQ
jgi:hypothetical protein